MTEFADPTDSGSQICSAEIFWLKIYRLLRPRVRHWVYSARVPLWLGEEEEVAEDIVQEAITKIFNYAQRAEHGEVDPIDSYIGFSIVTAHNCFKDRQKRDRRLILLSPYDCSYGGHIVLSDSVDAFSLALENIALEMLFAQLTQEVINFPPKQRTALLRDLANRICFGPVPTRLEKAFLKVGIHLQEYQVPLPDDPVERSRHASLLSLAYKRLRSLTFVNYLSAA